MLLLLGTVIAGVLWYVILVPKAAPQQTSQSTATLPVSGSVTPTPTASTNPSLATSPQTLQTMILATQSGTTVVASDFIHNNVTLPDPSNDGNYYLTGSSTSGFAIGYRTPAQFFTIALEQEPIGQTRIAAENFLLSTLGISQNQLCSLNYYVGTDVHTNSLYAGKNLGFSFCPGATVLPK